MVANATGVAIVTNRGYTQIVDTAGGKTNEGVEGVGDVVGNHNVAIVDDELAVVARPAEYHVAVIGDAVGEIRRGDTVGAGVGHSDQCFTIDMGAHILDGEDGVAATVGDSTTHFAGIIARSVGEGDGCTGADVDCYDGAVAGGDGGAAYKSSALHDVDGVAVPAVAIAVNGIDGDVASATFAIGHGTAHACLHVAGGAIGDNGEVIVGLCVQSTQGVAVARNAEDLNGVAFGSVVGPVGEGVGAGVEGVNPGDGHAFGSDVGCGDALHAEASGGCAEAYLVKAYTVAIAVGVTESQLEGGA